MAHELKAWYMDTSDPDKDQRDNHKYSPNRPVSMEDLVKKTKVLYYYIPVIEGEQYTENPELAKIRESRGYNYQDEIEIEKGKLENYEQKIKIFFEEHLHADEEIRYCLAGSGYFDVRDDEDTWVRIEMTPGDLIILPAGIYHRFTLDTKNYIKAKRFFVGEPVWTPHNRPGADGHSARQAYKQLLAEA